MQTVANRSNRRVAPQSFGVRVMLLSVDPEGVTAERLASYGSSLDTETEFYAALGAIIDDPLGYDLFVMDCDGFGGIIAAERAIATLIAADARMRIMLVSSEFETPAYPMGLRSAVSLPSPVSEASFRIGFEHVLRDRVSMRLM